MRKFMGLMLFVTILLLFAGIFNDKITFESLNYISISGSLLAIVQIIVLVVILMLGLSMIVPAFLIDVLVLIFTDMYFPLVGSTYNVVWNEITIGWFWTETTGSSLLFSSIILIIVSILSLRKKNKKR